MNLTASGGLNFWTRQTGAHSKSTDLNASANIVPHTTLSLNYFITSRISEISGEDRVFISEDHHNGCGGQLLSGSRRSTSSPA